MSGAAGVSSACANSMRTPLLGLRKMARVSCVPTVGPAAESGARARGSERGTGKGVRGGESNDGQSRWSKSLDSSIRFRLLATARTRMSGSPLLLGSTERPKSRSAALAARVAVQRAGGESTRSTNSGESQTQWKLACARSSAWKGRGVDAADASSCIGELRESCGVTKGSVEEWENGSGAAGPNRCRFAVRSPSSGVVGVGDAAGAAGGGGEERCFLAGISSLGVGLSWPSGGAGPGNMACAASGGDCGPRYLLAAGSSVPVERSLPVMAKSHLVV